MPKSNNALWTFFDKEVVPEFNYLLTVCKKCGQKKMPKSENATQSSTSSVKHHLKTKHPFDFAKLTKLTAEQEEKRAEDLKEIQEATVHLNEAQEKVALYFNMTSKGL